MAKGLGGLRDSCMTVAKVKTRLKNTNARYVVWSLLLVCQTLLLSACSIFAPESKDAANQPKILLVTVNKAPDSELEILQQSLADDYNLEAANDWPLHSLDIYCFIYKLPAATNTEPLLVRLGQDPRVDSAQLVKEFEILSNPEDSLPVAPSRNDAGQLYDDQHYPLQIGLKALKADKAHQWATGESVKVGVIDTGIDVTHKDLASVILTLSFVGQASDEVFAENHGTAIAGIIAASANNAVGIVGIAPDAEVIGLRACWQPAGTTQGRCNSLSLAKAIDYANVNSIKILNLSLQGPYDPIIERLLNHAVNHNAVVIAAYQPANTSFPASMPGVIAVTSDPALLSEHSLATTLVAAPGTDIITTIPAGQYDLLDGSSLAAAHVAGVAALLREQQPDLPAEAIADVLMQSAQKQSNADNSRMINACKAVGTLVDAEGVEQSC